MPQVLLLALPLHWKPLKGGGGRWFRRLLVKFGILLGSCPPCADSKPTLSVVISFVVSASWVGLRPGRIAWSKTKSANGHSMQRSLKARRGYVVTTTDGEVGKVHDFLFNGEFWKIPHMVVDTGGWVMGRKVLITPGVVVGTPHWRTQMIPVALTREEVKASPDIGADKPVWRQQEKLLRGYYGWRAHWTPGPATKSDGDPRLRSVREVTRHHLEASDGRMGHVEDFIAEEEMWEMW